MPMAAVASDLGPGLLARWGRVPGGGDTRGEAVTSVGAYGSCARAAAQVEAATALS